MRSPALLDTVERLLRRTYRVDAAIPGLAAFVVGDRGFRDLYGTVPTASIVGSGAGDGARTLFRETDEGIRAAIYLPDAMIRTLESHPPQRGIGERNVDAFAALVEEADHLLVVAERAAYGRPVSLFELELHANVSKHLVLSRFLAGSGRPLKERERVWLSWHLFHKGEWSHADPRICRRYAEAGRFAFRFLERLRGLEPGRRLARLREFHAAGAAEKLRLIDAPAS